MKFWVDTSSKISYNSYLVRYIGGSKGFDGVIEVGEAIRRHALIPKLKINAEDNLAYAA